MSIKLKIELVRFDAKMDYLPYRARLEVQIPSPQKEGLLELFRHIQAQLPDFAFEHSLPCARINGKVVYGEITLGEIIEKLGQEWFIEPLSERHALKDLIIDTAPYLAALNSVEAVIELSDEERARYLELLPLRYASPLARFSEEYLGESLFVFVDELLTYRMQEAHKLLVLVSDPQNGVMNATSLHPYLLRDAERFDAHIHSLQSKLLRGFPHYEEQWVEFGRKIDGLL
ncbi:MAG: DUF5644 domain-containing protein [Wolinella sp.]